MNSVFAGRECNGKFKVGDKVTHKITGVYGIVEKFYVPTACAEQTMIITPEGLRYHAPTIEFMKMQ